MATREQFQLSTEERRERTFSVEFKRQKVKEIELKQTTVLEVSKAYQVRPNNVYKWIEKYTSKDKNGVRLVVEMESETKRVLALMQKVALTPPVSTPKLPCQSAHDRKRHCRWQSQKPKSGNEASELTNPPWYRP